MDWELNLMQKALLEALGWFHEYCVINKLCYYAIGGTMLGAVRHQGFIPWDDDIDIGMPREDYERFLQQAEGKVFGKYTVESLHSGNDDFIYPFAKVYDRTTTLIEDARVPVKRGIYIDVFPLDGAGNTKQEAMKHYNKIKNNYMFLLTKVCDLNRNRKFYKNILIIFGRLIPDFLVNKKKLLLRIDIESKKIGFYQSQFVGNFVGNWGFRETMNRSYFGNPKIYLFHNINIYGVSDYDAYLTNVYGDYMKLPPIEQQKTHHTFSYCNLNESYIESKVLELERS